MRPKSRYRSNGVVRIQRDTYSNSKTSWYEIVERVLTRDHNRCVQCGKHKSEVTLNVHHRIPLSRGGRTVMSNLITLCEHHHKTRHKHL